jgi:hypothetical protein
MRKEIQTDERETKDLPEVQGNGEAAGEHGEVRTFTNRTKIIRQLIDRDDDVLFCFMCPYVPGEDGALCGENPEDADSYKHCRPCIKAWLDREADD